MTQTIADPCRRPAGIATRADAGNHFVVNPRVFDRAPRFRDNLNP